MVADNTPRGGKVSRIVFPFSFQLEYPTVAPNQSINGDCGLVNGFNARNLWEVAMILVNLHRYKAHTKFSGEGTTAAVSPFFFDVPLLLLVAVTSQFFSSDFELFSRIGLTGLF